MQSDAQKIVVPTELIPEHNRFVSHFRNVLEENRFSMLFSKFLDKNIANIQLTCIDFLLKEDGNKLFYIPVLSFHFQLQKKNNKSQTIIIDNIFLSGNQYTKNGFLIREENNCYIITLHPDASIMYLDDTRDISSSEDSLQRNINDYRKLLSFLSEIDFFRETENLSLSPFRSFLHNIFGSNKNIDKSRNLFFIASEH